MKKYDVIVIGAGGGVKISTPASKIGFKAAIIESGKLGGTCLNRGCIPSKMLIHPANVVTHIKDSKKYNFKANFLSINFSKLMQRINNSTDKNSESIAKSYAKNKNLDYYSAHAKFISNKVIDINGKLITAKKIVIATGARPNVPKIPGLEGTPFMTSKEALRRRKLPKKLLVIGGGYIGCELGHAYGAFGSDLHMIVRGGELLSREDKDVRSEFTKVFSKRYNVHLNVSTQKVSYDQKKKLFTLTLKHKNGKLKRITGDGLLVATGVKPNSDLLGLENTNIKLNSRGFVKVNNFMESTVKNIFAIGDVVGNYMFRHSVNFEGEYLFENQFVKKKKTQISYPPMPHAVFSYPEIAGVGVTEDELIKRKKKYIVGINSYGNSAQGMARLPEFGFVKLLFDAKNKKLLGVQMIGDEASIMVHQLIYAITFGAKLDDLLSMIYIHPALPEIVRNACRNAKKEFDNKSKK